MNRSCPGLLALLASLWALALAPAWAQAPVGPVVDSSYRLPDGERVMELSVDVPAPLDEVWRAFTTAEGFASWAVKVARVDLRVGGEYETSYNAAAQIGAPGNIRSAIVALVPHRLVVIRNVQAPPVTAFDVPTFQMLQTAVHFVPAGERITRVTLQNPGYRDGEKFDGVYKHFLMGNRWTLEKLREHFETPARP
jgi:uncharacterized protein YndB with AHSA1/START domain